MNAYNILSCNYILTFIGHIFLLILFLFLLYKTSKNTLNIIKTKYNIFINKKINIIQAASINETLNKGIDQTKNLLLNIKEMNNNEITLIKDKLLKYDTLINSIDDLILFIDDKGYIVDYIKTKKTPKHFLGKNIYNDLMINDDDVIKLQDAYINCILYNKSKYVDIVIKHKNTIYHKSVYITKCDNKNINNTYDDVAMLILRDIDNIKEREDEIIYKNTLLESIINNIPISIFMYAANDYKIKFYNKKFNDYIYNITEDKIVNPLGVTIHEIMKNVDFYKKDEKNNMIQKIDELNKYTIKNNNITKYIFTNPINEKYNDYNYVNSIKIPILFDNCKYILNIETDITKEEKMKKELLKQKKLIEDILNNIPLPVLIYSTDSIIKYVNKKYINYINNSYNLNYDFDDIVNMNIFNLINDFYDNDSINKMNEMNAILINNKKIVSEKIMRKDKNIIKITKSPILNKEGNVDFIVNIIEDVTNDENINVKINELLYVWETIINIINIINSKNKAHGAIINDALKCLAESLNIGRIYIYLNDIMDDKKMANLIHEWSNDKKYETINITKYKTINYDDMTYNNKSLYEYFKIGNILNDNISDVKKDEYLHELMSGINNKSILLIPLYNDGEFIGVIGFDDYKSENKFNFNQIYTLKIIATLLSSIV